MTRSQSLDILRAVAIFLVMLGHTKVYPGSNGLLVSVTDFLNTGGWTGVDLFFVLSGFLIAGLLFKEFSHYGTISFKQFFIRRGLKIYTAYYTMALATLLVVVSHVKSLEVIKSAIPWLIYLQDYIYTPIGFIWGH